MPKDLHNLLKRQIKKHLGDAEELPQDLGNLFNAVNSTYYHADEERAMLERSLDLSSQELREKNSEVRAIFQALPDIFFRIKTDGTILEYKAIEDTKYSDFLKNLNGRKLQNIFGSINSKKFKEAIDQLVTKKDLVSIEYTQELNGENTYFEARLQPLLEEQIVVIIRNITDRKIAEERLRHDALHDRLTALPNRALLLDRLSNMIARSKRTPNYLFAVLFIDLDRFKLINDSLGHLAGDILLMEISNRLKAQLRNIDTVARLGGDEFVILLEDIKDIKHAVVLAERIQQDVSEKIKIEDQEIYISASIGIAVNTPDTKDPEEMLRDADISMYRAKNDGKARHEIFNKDMHAEALKLIKIEGDLRLALKREEFFLEYQPIVSLKTGKILRFEALLRWNHPEQGIVPPLDFIPIAEETSLIIPIGEWVLQNACKQTKDWQNKGFDIGMSINFSGRQFQHQELLFTIKDIIQNTGADAFTLELEITESIAMKDINFTVQVLKKLKSMGLKVSIDDFGIGYSSLSCLKSFPLDSLKIDRTFVKSIPLNPDNTTITKAVIALGHSLGLKVVGEGIETKEQLDFLIDQGCDEGQGYLFSKPLPATDAVKFLEDKNYKFF